MSWLRSGNHKRDGDPLEPRDLNQILDEQARLRQLAGGPGLDVQGAAGDAPPRISLVRPGVMMARLTGGYSSGYPWEEVSIKPGRLGAVTGVTGGPASGSAAYERRTGDTGLAADGKVYEMRQSPASGDWLFARRSGSDTGVLVPSCSCPSIPRTLTLSIDHPEWIYHYLQSCTLQYQPVPSSLSHLSLGSYTFLSTTTFYNDLSYDPFYMHLWCGSATFYLDCVYTTSIFGAPYRDPAARCTWPLSSVGNTCSPFLMTASHYLGPLAPPGTTTINATLSA